MMKKMPKLQLNRETVRRITEQQLSELAVNGASGGTCPYCAIEIGQNTVLCSKAVVGTCLSAYQYCDPTDHPGCY